MTDVPLGITEFDDFVHSTYLYKSKEPNNKMLILKFVIKKSSNYPVRWLLFTKINTSLQVF